VGFFIVLIVDKNVEEDVKSNACDLTGQTNMGTQSCIQQDYSDNQPDDDVSLLPKSNRLGNIMRNWRNAIGPAETDRATL
jgi:hypothetical protein